MDDLISRQAAIDAIRKVDDYGDGIAFEVLSHAQRDISLLPSAERRGRWVNVNEGAWNAVIVPKCSICGETFYEMNVNINGEYTYNYCPNCGAKMDDNWEEPAINPCRGCEDYDGRGGCISKGGCGAKMEGEEE